MLTFLGLDPGTNNFAYGVVQVKGDKYRILEHGMILHPLKELTGLDVGARSSKFRNEIQRIRRRHNAEFVTAERYMTRGHGGTTIEAISLMLGLVATVFKNNTCFVTAASWKNSWNKHYDLKEFYEELKPYGIPTHRIDAVNIALYGATTVHKKPHFFMLNNIKRFRSSLVNSRQRVR